MDKYQRINKPEHKKPKQTWESDIVLWIDLWLLREKSHGFKLDIQQLPETLGPSDKTWMKPQLGPFTMGLLLFTRDADVCHQLPWWPKWPWWPRDLHGRNAPRVGHLAKRFEDAGG